jgi:hypothetical protein
MKAILLALTIIVSSLSFADQISDLQAFFTASVGTWSGQGQGQKPGKQYPITVQQVVAQTAPFAWNFTSSITNDSGKPVQSNADYEITTNGLYLTLPSNQVLAELQVVTPQHIVFTLNTSATATVVRDMTLTSPRTMTVLSVVYQNGSVFQTFQYDLQKH